MAFNHSIFLVHKGNKKKKTERHKLHYKPSLSSWIVIVLMLLEDTQVNIAPTYEISRHNILKFLTYCNTYKQHGEAFVAYTKL